MQTIGSAGASSSSTTANKKLKLIKPSQIWTFEEIKAIEEGLEKVKGPHWVKIKELTGDRLSDRTGTQIKNKMRIVVGPIEEKRCQYCNNSIIQIH